MATQKRSELKKYFETGDTPSSEDFSNLIDSTINKMDDAIFIKSKNVGLGTISPKNRLDIAGSLAVGTGYAGEQPAPPNSLIVQEKLGIGIATPQEALSVNGSIAIKEQGNTDGYGKLFARETPMYSLHFDGESSYVDLTSHKDNFHQSDSGSIGFWYHPIDAFRKRHILYFGDSGANTAFSIRFGGIPNDDQAGLVVSRHEGDQRKFRMYMPKGAQVFTELRWYQIVIRIGLEENKIFIDGEETHVIIDKEESTGNFLISPNEDTLFLIGAKPTGQELSSKFSGDLDEFFILNRELEQTEIKHIFKKGRELNVLPLLTNDLIAYWRFGENGSEEEIHDQTSNANHGMPYGVELVERKKRELCFRDSLGNESLLTSSSDVGVNSSIWDKVGSSVVYMNGNVGINKSEPVRMLHIKENISGRAAIRLEGTRGYAKTWDIGSEDDAGKGTFIINKIGDIGYNDFRAFTITEDGNIGMGITTPKTKLTVHGHFIREMKIATGLGPNDEVDNGQILSRVLNFTKHYDETYIRIIYCDNFRLEGASPCSGRWEIKIDGKVPPEGAIYQDKYNHTGGYNNFHEPATIMGYAGGIKTGNHQIQVWVTPLVPGSNLYTGWNNSRWTIEAQEVWIEN